ncbi:85/88 kDa calcium-independent phospholipase A2 isoform X2 [Aplysia californica]|uniref:phospholipase A2 n=1 Tax=Aplysia californica TaxID=6500 RepID=A0ABM1VNR9_APLCA|nr:85/88 kDa calcium-independent phospholipase A2 isoform X2 [Aplysia californica]
MSGFLRNLASGINEIVTVAQAKISPFTVQVTTAEKLKGSFLGWRTLSSYQSSAYCYQKIRSNPCGRPVARAALSSRLLTCASSVVSHPSGIRTYSTKGPWDWESWDSDKFAHGINDLLSETEALVAPFDVHDIGPLRLKGCTVLKQDGCLTLYRRSTTFECVITRPDVPGKMYSLFRQTSEEEAQVLYKLLVAVLVPMVNSGALHLQEEVLQKICDCIREHPSWNSAHVSANLGHHGCLRHPGIKENINTVCSTHSMSPLMTAITGKQAPAAEEVLRLGGQLGQADKHGDTAYHFAVLNCPPVVALLVDFDKQGVINSLNAKGESALYLACERKLTEATEILLGAGADPRVAGADCLPIHAAIRSRDLKSFELIVSKHPEQANAKDYKTGGSPLHWAEDVETIQKLALLGCQLDITDSNGDAPLHIMMAKKKSDCLLALLCHGANCNLLDAKGESVLHKAIQEDNLDLVRQFVVFGADVNQASGSGVKPRHMAAVNRGRNSSSYSFLRREQPVGDTILYLLHVSGATRCSTSMSGCNSGCSAEGTVNGTPDQTMSALMKLDNVALFDEQLCSTVVHSATSPQHRGSVIDMTDTPVSAGERILCLDGGGIRGLVLIQILMEIEAAVGRPIRECFDWIGGTSTGGILAMGIAKGFSLPYMKGLYVRLKDEVFKGTRPYDPAQFEVFLKREFGEDTVMTDLKHPKLLVSAVLGDRFPADLHFFRNFERTLNHPSSSPPNQLEALTPPHEQKLWEAARSSGAAPTYFRGYGSYLDGGLISNNPTLDVLTEVHEYNMGLKMLGRSGEARQMGCVISLGCGRPPCEEVKNMDVFLPGGIMDVYKAVAGATALGRLMVDQATISEGRPVDRARAWCSMINVPYYRFSPLLSEDISLDCHDIQVLINMMWQTHCYMVANRHRVREIASLLQPRKAAGDS